MKVVLNERHGQHDPRLELFRGRMVPAFETPARVTRVLEALQGTRHAPVLAPRDHGMAPLERVHTPSYLRFLASAHDEWRAAGGEGDAFPAVWPVRTLRSDIEPASLAGRMGLYSMDSGTPLTAGSWAAAYSGAQASLTALDLVAAGEPCAYALTRPPGHHAGADFFGGYCFMNNAAVCAAAALAAGAGRVAILDVDYHHGNGTQAIFYDRRDVLYVSVHGDPTTEYPFFLGHADEGGRVRASAST
jgi:acetoin utilization deacetylase AcuC-like enzyme